jgi:putative membrane protein
MSHETLAIAATRLYAWGHDGWGDGWMWFWGGLMVVLWVALVVGAIWLVATRPGQSPPPPTDRAREILAERYARGEIGGDEYRERLGTLR